MDGDERSGRFDHLFAEPIRETISLETYGAWRAVRSADAVSLSFGFPFPSSFPDQELIDAAEGLFEDEPEVALQYGGGEYSKGLQDAIVERSRTRGIPCDPDDVVLTNGATHAIDVVCRTFLDPGDGLIVESPTFMGALYAFRNYGVTVDGCPMDKHGLDVEVLAETLRRRRDAGEGIPTLVYTIPTFQNPTGTTMSLDRRRRLLELAAEYDFVVLEDDAYGELRYEGAPVPTLAELDDDGRVVHVGTFSKTIAPGIRTGWAIAHEEIADALKGVAVGGSNTFTRGLLGRYFHDGYYEETLEALRSEYAHRRDHMLACLERELPPEATWTEPEGGFFVWVEFDAPVDTEELLYDAAEEGVTFLPGSMFFPDEGGENALRISFSYVSPEEMEAGIEALGRAARNMLDRIE